MALAAALVSGGCATKGVPPTDQMVNARAAIAQAERVGAVNGAPVELLAAREKLAQAEAAAREERFEAARRLAEQAEADAILAERRSRAQRAQIAADELARSNAMLRKELERSTR